MLTLLSTHKQQPPEKGTSTCRGLITAASKEARKNLCITLFPLPHISPIYLLSVEHLTATSKGTRKNFCDTFFPLLHSSPIHRLVLDITEHPIHALSTI